MTPGERKTGAGRVKRIKSLHRRLALLIAAALLSSCSRAPARRPPDVVIISVDTLRADHLPAYGYGGVATPAIDRFRKDAILYANAYAHVPLTVPSHATILTGLLPYENGVRDNTGFRLAETHQTLATLLAAHGYATGAAVSSFALRRDRGLAAGFDFYDDAFPEQSPDERPGVETARKLENWVESPAGEGKPKLLFLHIYEPHAPYLPPEPFRSRYAANPYDGEIAAADAAVGDFLEFLRRHGTYDASLIFFLSDHGEGLNDHGEDEHGVFLYRETIRVPLIVKLPGSLGRGGTATAPVGLVDIFPTVRSFAGVKRPASAGAPAGSPLVDAGGAVPPESHRQIYSETLYPRIHFAWSDLASLTDSRYQYIEAPRPELYDVVADPGERTDLSAGRIAPFRSLRYALSRVQRPSGIAGAAAPATREEVARLGSLGYISARAETSGPLPDPKDRIEALRQYKRLFEMFYQSRNVEAIAVAREILARDPAMLSVSRILAASLDRSGRSKEAARELETAIARRSASGADEDLVQGYEELASLLAKTGDEKNAERVLRTAMDRGIASDPMKRILAGILARTGRAAEALPLLPPASQAGNAESLELRGVALAESGRPAEARQAFLAALKADPRNANALFHLGVLAMSERDPESARQWLEKSLAVNPKAPAALSSLGLVRSQLGDQAGALESWRRAVEIDPAQYEAMFNSAVLTGKMGHTGEARDQLSRFLAAAPPERFGRERSEAERLLRLIAASRARAGG